MKSLVKTIPDGPLDIIGDIHGEYEALMALLALLGYSHIGKHPQGRRLVFTGDLVDRGPDSPAVLEAVMQMVEAGFAFCVLGNHELNILRAVLKGGNDWILAPKKNHPSDSVQSVADPAQGRRFIEFLESQPFVLANTQLRVVHACWNTASVEALGILNRQQMPIGELYQRLESDIFAQLESKSVMALKRRELDSHEADIANPDWTPVFLPGHAGVDVALQMDNPLRVLTTSEEQPAETPFWAGGKWRMAERSSWWDHYDEQVPVVIGHFWRLFGADSRRVSGMFGRDVFEGIPSHAWMGEQRNVYCVDYSVGQRHLERRESEVEEFHGKLAALRFPEWEVVHDDGSVIAIGPPGK